MTVSVRTHPDVTQFRFPNDPHLDELHDAETERSAVNSNWWSQLLQTLLVLALVGLASWNGASDRAILRTALLCWMGQLIGVLIRRTLVYRRYAKARATWIEEVRRDPTWTPSDTDKPV